MLSLDLSTPKQAVARRGTAHDVDSLRLGPALSERRSMAVQAFAIVWLLLGVLLAAQPAAAGGVNLRSMLWGSHGEPPRHPDAPPVGRYQPDRGEGFVLDESGTPTLLKFEDSPEVWVLRAQPGPRGDTIYRNDMGEPVLRATKLGGLTLFTLDNPDGSAVAYDGEAGSLRPPAVMSASVLFQHMYQASVRSSHAAQRVIPFISVDDATPETAALIADSATVTAEAISRVAHLANGRTALSRVVKVLLAKGRRPDAQLGVGGALTVIYAPEAGVEGRPSSERIVHIIVK